MKRIKYIPGIISLIGLPILCMLYLHSHNYFRKTALNITMCDKYNFEKDKTNAFVCFEEILKNNIHEHEFILTNNSIHNLKEFERFQQYVKNFKLGKKKDRYSTFQISNAIKYQYVIELLNQFYIQEISLYSLEKNTLYFVPYYKNTSNDIDCEIKIIDL